MSRDPERRRRYSDEEVRRLLARASELEREGGVSSDGPTLDELEAIAAEAGIEPALVRRAARELESSGSRSVTRGDATERLLGGPLTLRFQRAVPREVEPGTLEAMLAPIQRAAGDAGSAQVLERSLTWNVPEGENRPSTHVSVVVSRGETQIHVEERYRKVAGGIFGGLVGGVGCGVGFGVGMGVGFGALGSALFAFGFPVVVLGGTYAAARAAFGRTVGKRERALRDLTDELARVAGE